MTSKIDMQQVMRALESVRGAPVLTSNQCADLAKALNAAAPEAPHQAVARYKIYTTQPAESLAGMAARQLKDERRWIEIRDANSLEFPDMGPSDYYPVGSAIRIPPLSPDHSGGGAGVVLPERLPMRPYQTVDKGSTNYKAGFNAAIKQAEELNASLDKVKELNQ